MHWTQGSLLAGVIVLFFFSPYAHTGGGGGRVTFDGLASHPMGVASPLSHFLVWRMGISTGPVRRSPLCLGTLYFLGR